MLSVQTKVCSSEKVAVEFIKNIENAIESFYPRYWLKSDNSVKLGEIQGFSPTMFLRWLAEDKLMVIIRSDEPLYTIPEELNNIDNDAAQKLFVLKQDYKQLEIKENHTRQENEQLKNFNLIKKVSYNGKFVSPLILNLLKNQDPDNIKIALIIQEQYSKHIWFIYGYSNGICSCYANLNNNDFAEFGSVRFSDIVEAFGLGSGGDDNNFSVSTLNYSETPTYNQIVNFCKRI